MEDGKVRTSGMGETIATAGNAVIVGGIVDEEGTSGIVGALGMGGITDGAVGNNDWSFKCSRAEYLEGGGGLLAAEGWSGFRTTVRSGAGVDTVLVAEVVQVQANAPTTTGGTKPGGGGSLNADCSGDFMSAKLSEVGKGENANKLLWLVFGDSEGTGFEE